MFPIPWNFPFRKKNGDMSTIGEVIGGAGSELPPHGVGDAGKLLGVKPNGSLEWSDTVNSEIQTLTKYANAQSNPNLLDNPWFTVNQRGQSSYSNVGYTVDRWYLGSSDAGTKSVTVNSDETVTVANEAADSTMVYFFQRLDKATTDKLLNKMVTISVMLSDGTIFSTSKTFAAVIFGYITVNDVRLGGYRIWINSTTGVAELTIDVYAGKSISITAVKLELGEVSTLASDTTPNYATELAKCQRYFVRLKPIFNSLYAGIGTGIVVANTEARLFVPMPGSFRGVPSVSFNLDTDKIKIFKGSTASENKKSVTNIAINQFAVNNIVLTLTTESLSGALSQGDYIECWFMNTSSAYIDFSADL